MYLFARNLALLHINKKKRCRSACASAQSYQLALESMIAKPASCKNAKIENKIPPSEMRGAARIQTTPMGRWGGGGRERFVPVSLLGNI